MDKFSVSYFHYTRGERSKRFATLEDAREAFAKCVSCAVRGAAIESVLLYQGGNIVDSWGT